jgi:hypothetical protein
MVYKSKSMNLKSNRRTANHHLIL